jgi:serine/threonine-protein kinase RsbW
MKTINPMKPYELIVPGDTRSLALVRMVTTAVASEAGLDQEIIDKIEVAVDEACTNVIEHGYGTMNPHPPVEIRIKADDREFVIDIVDSGPAFDFENRVRNKFPDYWMHADTTRGAGLYLMMALMDSVDYEIMPDSRNRMRLVKKII